jgi:hypothetical protein
VSNVSLQEAIMQALRDNPHVHADEIAVDVQGGDVVSAGTVGSPVQHVEAARTTRGLRGVKHVNDQLQTKLLGVDGRADVDTEAAVLDALIADDGLHATTSTSRSTTARSSCAAWLSGPTNASRRSGSRWTSRASRACITSSSSGAWPPPSTPACAPMRAKTTIDDIEAFGVPAAGHLAERLKRIRRDAVSNASGEARGCFLRCRSLVTGSTGLPGRARRSSCSALTARRGHGRWDPCSRRCAHGIRTRCPSRGATIPTPPIFSGRQYWRSPGRRSGRGARALLGAHA